MAALPAVMQGLGAATQVVGAIHQGRAEAAADEYNASVNAQNAQQTRMQSAEEERRARAMGRKFLGSARAGYAASGVQLEGSALDVLEESASSAELDALTIRHGGQIRAQGFENEARLDRFRGKTAKTNSYFSAAGTLLSKGGAIAGSA